MPIDPGSPERKGAPPSPQTVADVLVLLRLVLGEGRADERVRGVLCRVARRAFGIDALSIEPVIAAVDNRDAKDVALTEAEFRARPWDERIRLAGVLLALSEDDEELKTRQKRLRGRIAAILLLDEADLK